jgi:hypothetical protein
VQVAIIVEPVLTLEKLRECLNEQHEQPALDYKRSMDLKTTKDVLELAKDVGAFQSEPNGGYIVVGADGQGTPVDDMIGIDTLQFDEARLRSRLEGYFSAATDLRSAIHSVDGKILVLIYIGPAKNGWNMFARNGEYQDPTSKQSRFIFREGEVFVRRGTSSVRWRAEDQERLLQQVMTARRESWRKELREELSATARVRASVEHLRRGGDSETLSWRIDVAGFDELVLQLLRDADDIPLRRMLFEARRDATSLYKSGPNELTDLIDRVAELAALALSYSRNDWFESAIAVLVRIYENGFDHRGFETENRASVELWLEVVSRVHALGALATRLGAWDAVAHLASRRPRGEQFKWYGSWLRHALTMAARANMIDGELNLIARSANIVRRLEVLRPDIDPTDEELVTSLCQFDVYGCFNVMGARKSIDSGNFYPSFARYQSHRSEPAFLRLIDDAEVRNGIFGEDLEWLAVCMKTLIYRAEHEGMRYMNWIGLNDGRVQEFLREHLPS